MKKSWTITSAGQSFVIETDSSDKLRTREQIVVEDLPNYLSRIEAYIAQVDQPPKQVLIEAHVLEVELKDDTTHGVDIQELLLRINNTRINLRTTGFANPMASPAFFLDFDGADLDALIEAIKTTTDAKTLASPKVLVLNGQESVIQIGEKIGYLLTTTTQTSTLQQVSFLDVGVVLRVTPYISDDNRILMKVKPKVSTGELNAITGLPDEETTEVDTTVMLADGQAMIIGGLIKETDRDAQSKIPLVGDLWLIGRLFQRRIRVRQRTEIIIALVPRIVPYPLEYEHRERIEVARATTPLLDGRLNRINRLPFEPDLPDAMHDPRGLRLNRVSHLFKNLFEPYPNPPEYYVPSVVEEMPWTYEFPLQAPNTVDLLSLPPIAPSPIDSIDINDALPPSADDDDIRHGHKLREGEAPAEPLER